MILIVGLSLFLVFQTIPILVRNPPPVGFGGDPITTTRVQLPFVLILLVFGPTSGFIISKVGTAKSLILGTVISTVGEKMHMTKSNSKRLKQNTRKYQRSMVHR
ncbi:MAG: hypothetical protein WA631_12255 [Nitrososphaeraceae archaeon]